MLSIQFCIGSNPWVISVACGNLFLIWKFKIPVLAAALPPNRWGRCMHFLVLKYDSKLFCTPTSCSHVERCILPPTNNINHVHALMLSDAFYQPITNQQPIEILIYFSSDIGCQFHTLTKSYPIPWHPWLYTVLTIHVVLYLWMYCWKAKWGEHYDGIRCCQPIRCSLITDGERSEWWHIICTRSSLFPTEGRRGCCCLVEYAGWR